MALAAAVLAITVVAVVVAFPAARDRARAGSLDHAVRSVEPEEVVDLAEVADYDWRCAHVVAPYTVSDDIQRQLGLDELWSPPGLLNKLTGNDQVLDGDNRHLLALMRGPEIVAQTVVDGPALARLPRRSPFARGGAQFRADGAGRLKPPAGSGDPEGVCGGRTAAG